MSLVARGDAARAESYAPCMARLDYSQLLYPLPQAPELWLTEREIAAIRAMEMRVEADARKARIPLWRRILHLPPPLPFE
jgi:hypothetical protein